MFGAILGGLFRWLFAPVLAWFHHSAVRQQAIVDTLKDAELKQAQATIEVIRGAKQTNETIDRQSRADIDATLNELYRLRHPEAFRK